MEDHYTARTHKKERNALIEKLQELAADYSVRVTILGGDVHLAALGRFYSNPDLHVSAEKDHRYMVNVISSAITNEPPPRPVADYLAWRNVVHHLTPQPEEAMLGLFNKDPGESKKTAGNNNTEPTHEFGKLLTLAPEPEPASLVVPTPAAVPSRKPRSRRRLTKALLLPGPFRRRLKL